MFFKGNIKVRIIVVYLHADPNARIQRQTVQSQLIELINASRNVKYHTILMGDFNAHLERFYHSVSKNNKGRWQYTLFHYLQLHRFTDLQLMFSADQANPDPTFKSPQNGVTTRIDAIFTSPNFPFIPLHCHTRKSFLYLSDHLIVAAYFQPIESKKERHDKRLSTKHKIYNVSSMEAEDWQAFADYSDKYFKDHNYKKYEGLTSNKNNLNVLWTKIKELLITTVNHFIPCIYRSSEASHPKPKTLTSCYTALKKLNNILLRFRTKYLSRSLWPDDQQWTLIKDTLHLILSEHHLDPVDFPPILQLDNVKQVKKQLLTIYKEVYLKARLEQRIIEQKQIQHHIQLRCTNYDEDLTKMIDSILNRAKQTIVLDRIIVKDPVHGQILITDPKHIQTYAVQHFQQYALPPTAPPQMNE